MRIRSKEYIRDFRAFLLALGGFGCLIGSCVEIAVANRPAAEVIFLHYSVVAGVSVTGVWSELYFIPAIGGLFWLIDLFWSWRVYSEERALAYVLAATGFLAMAGMWWGMHLLLVFNG